MHWGKALDRLRRTWGESGTHLVSMCLEKSNRRRCLLDFSGSETWETWSARCSRRPRTSSFIGVLLYCTEFSQPVQVDWSSVKFSTFLLPSLKNVIWILKHVKSIKAVLLFIVPFSAPSSLNWTGNETVLNICYCPESLNETWSIGELPKNLDTTRCLATPFFPVHLLYWSNVTFIFIQNL